MFSKNNLIKKLNRTIDQSKNSDLYKSKLRNVSSIKVINDFKALPFTTKQDLRECYPYGGLAVPIEEVIEIHTSSGTSGAPVGSFLTKTDIDISSEHISKAWEAFGITNKSRVLFAMRYGLFSGAPINTYALQNLGAFVVPAGIIQIDNYIDMIFDYDIDTLVALPGFYEYLHSRLINREIDLSKLPLKRVIAAGETYSEHTRESIEKKLNVKVFDHYGLAEVNTGIAYECSYKTGLHILDDYVFAEVVRENGEQAPVGESGELVLTSLGKKASPVIRYKTGDIVENKGVPNCRCGVKSSMIGRISGRVDSIISIKGIKIDPYELRSELQVAFPKAMHHGVCSFRVRKNRIDYTPTLLVVSGLLENEKLKLKEFLKKRTHINFAVDTLPLSYWFDDKNKPKLVEYE